MFQEREKGDRQTRPLEKINFYLIICTITSLGYNAAALFVDIIYPEFSSGKTFFFPGNLTHPFSALKCREMLLGLKRD